MLLNSICKASRYIKKIPQTTAYAQYYFTSGLTLDFMCIHMSFSTLNCSLEYHWKQCMAHHICQQQTTALAKAKMQYRAFSIATDVRRYMSSIVQSLIAYFIDRKSVGYIGFCEKVA